MGHSRRSIREVVHTTRASQLRDRPGLGLGDAKLLAAGGAWLTLADLPWVVLVASLGAISFAMARQSRKAPLAFGPWIALAIAIIWLLRVKQFSY